MGISGISQGPGPTHQGPGPTHHESGHAPHESGPAPHRSGPSRRFLLAGLGTAAASAALSACSVPASPRRTTTTADPMPGKAISIARHDRLMQILAHPDDDMYFMNPDTQRMLDSGTPLICVYVTAGEATGINVVAGQPHPAPDKPAYSSARHQGLRQAYAVQLGLPPFTQWQKDVIALRGGHRAEINTLVRGARRVELIFLNTAMHTAHGRLGLPSLWTDRGLSLRTVVAEGSPLQEAGAYTYDAMVDVLTGLMAQYRPTVIHTLDPDPDIQHSPNAVRRKDSEQVGYSDHADHTATASFSWAAMIRWVAEATQGKGEVPAFVATSYRGYYNRHWPKNLSPKVLAQKAANLLPYGGDEAWNCGNPGGCGDYNVGIGRPLTNKKGWVRSTHYRYPGPRPVLATEPDGRLAGYGVLGLRAVRWRETAPGNGQWGPPHDLGGGPLAPTLGAAALKDGRQLLFGLRFSSIAGHGSTNTREIVLLQQRTPGGKFAAWTGLGNPEGDPDRGRRIGVPVAVTDRAGQVHLFVRDADQGISTRVRSTGGSWSPWRSLGGGQIQDGLSATVDTAGRVHVFASGRDTVHHWTQTAAGGPVVLYPDPLLPLPGDFPTAVAAKDGGVDVYYRGPATAATTHVHLGGNRPGTRPGTPSGARPQGPALLGQDDQGRIQLLLDGKVLRRTDGVVPLAGAALLAEGTGTAGDSSGPTVAGLGPGALPWLWRPVRAV
ncbi:PIG-L family deacetylase [Streptomyces sp. NBC_01471]|uniref:PIG-L family deacetylase n=1 Tax=Streptomyces sp. NBC_01471 TaxID=2903879 RepID=UPI00324C8F66